MEKIEYLLNKVEQGYKTAEVLNEALELKVAIPSEDIGQKFRGIPELQKTGLRTGREIIKNVLDRVGEEQMKREDIIKFIKTDYSYYKLHIEAITDEISDEVKSSKNFLDKLINYIIDEAIAKKFLSKEGESIFIDQEKNKPIIYRTTLEKLGSFFGSKNSRALTEEEPIEQRRVSEIFTVDIGETFESIAEDINKVYASLNMSRLESVILSAFKVLIREKKGKSNYSRVAANLSIGRDDAAQESWNVYINTVGYTGISEAEKYIIAESRQRATKDELYDHILNNFKLYLPEIDQSILGLIRGKEDFPRRLYNRIISILIKNEKMFTHPEEPDEIYAVGAIYISKGAGKTTGVEIVVIKIHLNGYAELMI